MEPIRAEEISQIISKQIKEYEKKLDISETGTVLSVGDGIARIYGVQNAMAMELLEFPGGILGMVLNLERDNVGVAILGDDTHIKEGDIVSLDFGILNDGYYGDAAVTVPVGAVSPEARRLLRVTEEALYRGIAAARAGNRIGDISAAIQGHVEAAGFSVVRDLVGHGIGKSLHEDPQVPNYGTSGRGIELKPGMVFAIEPMVNEGTYRVDVLRDGWTVVTADGKLSAHFEHSVAITDNGPVILSRLD